LKNTFSTRCFVDFVWGILQKKKKGCKQLIEETSCFFSFTSIFVEMEPISKNEDENKKKTLILRFELSKTCFFLIDNFKN
jgi:hypothetical protein